MFYFCFPCQNRPPWLRFEVNGNQRWMDENQKIRIMLNNHRLKKADWIWTLRATFQRNGLPSGWHWEFSNWTEENTSKLKWKSKVNRCRRIPVLGNEVPNSCSHFESNHKKNDITWPLEIQIDNYFPIRKQNTISSSTNTSLLQQWKC